MTILQTKIFNVYYNKLITPFPHPFFRDFWVCEASMLESANPYVKYGARESQSAQRMILPLIL